MLADVLSGKRALCLTSGGEKRLCAYSSFFRSGGNSGNRGVETVFFGAGSRRFARTLYVFGRQVVGSVAEDGMKWKRKKDVFSSEKHCFPLEKALFCPR